MPRKYVNIFNGMFTLTDTDSDRLYTDYNGCKSIIKWSYCTETDTDTDSHWAVYLFYQ